MRALVLGARGKVGQAVVEELARAGVHTDEAGRRPFAGGVLIDPSLSQGRETLREIACNYDVIVNTSGVEDPELVTGLSPAIFVDVSASGAYLHLLLESGRPVVCGAGLAPGLTTVLTSMLDSHRGDNIDVIVLLGGGEEHGPAAVEWTGNLAGKAIYRPPEDEQILNYRQKRRLWSPDGDRVYLRADFPDHVLIGINKGIAVRTWLAIDSRIATGALAIVGRAPGLARGLRHAPHVGGPEWAVAAVNRRTGQRASACGEVQSRTTGRLAARAAIAAVRRGTPGPMTSADLLDLDALRDMGVETYLSDGFLS